MVSVVFLEQRVQVVAFLSDESQQLLMSLAGFNQLSLDAEANTYVARAQLQIQV